MFVNLADYLEETILGLGFLSPIIACLLIVIESMVPILPLCVFITINFICFGSFWGFIISWVFTCIGCLLSYFLVKNGFKNWQANKNDEQLLLQKYINNLKNLSLPIMSLLVAIPFTPAFLVNISAGMIKMNFKKFLLAIMIGKLFMVYFWGYIGVGLVQSFKNPFILIKIVILISLSALVSIILNKVLKIK